MKPGRSSCVEIFEPCSTFEPPATEDEIHAAALQFVRTLSRFDKPSRTNEVAFAQAVDAVAVTAGRLIVSLSTSATPRDRSLEAESAREHVHPCVSRFADATERDPVLAVALLATTLRDETIAQ